ncbi:hypothetical protein RCL1_001195 [Eukaryota sp. TZLM3-RCL]
MLSSSTGSPSSLFLKCLLSSSRAKTLVAEKDLNKALNELQSNASTLKSLPPRPLETTREAARILKLNLDNLPVVHVAGTKGKGTVSSLTEYLLRKAYPSKRTSLYTSPHLIDVRERIRIDGKPISKKLFEHYFWQVFKELSNSPNLPNDTMPPYFRFLTLLYFYICQKEKIPINVVEVGIGGLNDSTNICHPIATGISTIGLDHQNVLGSTITEIAQHKAGIAKPNIPLYTIPQSAEVLEVIKNRAEQVGADYKIARKVSNNILKYVPLKPFNEPNTSLAFELADRFQVCQLGGKSWYDGEVLKPPKRVVEALTGFKWPGRFQIVNRKTTQFYLDGAHTVDSIIVSSNWFWDRVGDAKNTTLIFNVTGDRDVVSHLKSIQNISKFKNAIFFSPKIAQEWVDLGGCPPTVMTSVPEATTYAQRLKGNVLITGSLHLVGDSLSALKVKL